MALEEGIITLPDINRGKKYFAMIGPVCAATDDYIERGKYIEVGTI